MEKPKCPHCGVELLTVETPLLSDWYGTELEMCLNDMCDYFLQSWKVLFKQTGASVGYRYALNGGGSVLVGSVDTFKDCVVTDEDRKQRDEETAKKEKERMDLCMAIIRAEDEVMIFEDLHDEVKAEQKRQLVQWLKQLRKIKYPGTKKP